MKYYLIAGEASGDLHGSNLIRELLKMDPLAEIRCWGGDKMAEAGGHVVKHYKELAFMGFAEVIKNLPAIFKNLSFCKKDIWNFAPDALIFIDYPGFNMRIAKWARVKGYKTIYYISPQAWAWKENRVKSIKRDIDKMIVILPFEKEFYHKWNYDVDYVGHPLVQVVNDFKRSHPELQKNEKMVALLPGSRKQEIKVKLPIMLSATTHFPDITFAIAKAPSIEDNFYQEFIASYPNVRTESNNTYALLMQSVAALVTSGTATLETALFKVPEIVCYKANSISYEIGKRLIKLKFISLVNLIMNREVVQELIQHDLTPQKITQGLDELLHNQNKRTKMMEEYDALSTLLSMGGNASANAAKIIYEFTIKK